MYECSNCQNLLVYPPDLTYSSIENKIKYIENIIKLWEEEKNRLQELLDNCL